MAGIGTVMFGGMACLAMAVAMPGQASAQARFLTGNGLYKGCSIKRETCLVYGVSVIDTLSFVGSIEGSNIKPWFCIRNGVGMGQVGDIVFNYLRDHPEERDFPAPVVVSNALSKAFPCK